MYHFAYRLDVLLNVYSASDSDYFSSKSKAENVSLPFKYFSVGVTSAYLLMRNAVQLSSR